MPEQPYPQEPTFGQRLQGLRERRGLTRVVLAGLVGRSPSWVKKIERQNVMPSLDMLVRLARALKLQTVDELVGPMELPVGIETRTERVSLPRDMPDVVNGGEDGDRQVFTEDTRIIFNSDGSFVWRLANGNGPLQRAESSDNPRYLIGEKGAKLYVRGTVSGISRS